MTADRSAGGPIIAIGGADLALGAENERLHDYVVAQIPRRGRARACLLPTASGDPVHQIGAFAAAMERRGCEASALSLFRLGESRIDLREHLLSQDLIYVTGGNMVNLMALWREHGIDRILIEAHGRGTVLCGYSAGSMCWFEQGISTGVGEPVPAAGLGLLAGSHCVHYGQDRDRRRVYRSLIAGGRLAPGLALDDHAAALYRRGELVEVVRSVASARAFAVRADGNGASSASEVPLPGRTLEAGTRGEPTGIDEMRALRRLRARSGGR